MKFTARTGDRTHEVTIRREDARYLVNVDGTDHEVDVRKLGDGFYSLLFENRSFEVSVEAEGDRLLVRRGATTQVVTLTDPGRAAREKLASADGPQAVVSVMPGKVVRLLVEEGDAVREGQGLVVVEAMKMENEITSPKDGKVARIGAEAGTAVEAGATLVVVE